MENNPRSEEENVRFKVFDVLYAKSEGFTQATIPLDTFYEQLQVSNVDEQNQIQQAIHYLVDYGFVLWGLGAAKITHGGIVEYEDAILLPHSHIDHFPLDTIQSVSTELKKKEIETIQSQRSAFLLELSKLSGGNTMQQVSSSEVLKPLGYDLKTFQKIFFFLLDEGLMKSLAAGGGILAITRGG